MQINAYWHVTLTPDDMGEEWPDIDLGYCQAKPYMANFTITLHNGAERLVVGTGKVTGKRKLKGGGLGQPVTKDNYWRSEMPAWLKRAQARALQVAIELDLSELDPRE